jgi:hypothetical protein
MWPNKLSSTWEIGTASCKNFKWPFYKWTHVKEIPVCLLGRSENLQLFLASCSFPLITSTRNLHMVLGAVLISDDLDINWVSLLYTIGNNARRKKRIQYSLFCGRSAWYYQSTSISKQRKKWKEKKMILNWKRSQDCHCSSL